MQVLGFSSTTREDLILKLLSCFINPLHLCAVHFARIDSIDPVQLSAGLEGTCGNDDGCGQGLRLWNCFEYWILPNAARCGLSFFGCSQWLYTRSQMGPQPRLNSCYYDLTFMYLELILYPYYVFYLSPWPRFIVFYMFCLVYHIKNCLQHLFIVLQACS